MRRLLCVVVLSCGALAFGQDEPKPDELKKMYDEAKVQLRQAQERKNELASQLADVQKKLDVAQSKLDDTSRASADFSRKTFFLRAQYAAWREFISHNPKIEHQWDV